MSHSNLGKGLTLYAIATTVGVFLFVYSIEARHIVPGSALVAVAAILTCAQSYIGSNWARWVIGCILLLPGVIWAYKFSVEGVAPINPLSGVALLLTAAALTSGLGVMASSSVGRFLRQQAAVQMPRARRILRALWLLLLVAFAVIVVLDVLR